MDSADDDETIELPRSVALQVIGALRFAASNISPDLPAHPYLRLASTLSEKCWPRFPLSGSDRKVIATLCAHLRGHLRKGDPSFIRKAALALLVLERLPRSTSGLQLTIGREMRGGGDSSWGDLSISENEIGAGIGTHVRGDWGGDTESSRLFECQVGADRCFGSLEDWLDQSRMLADAAVLAISVESAWSEDELEEKIGEWEEEDALFGET